MMRETILPKRERVLLLVMNSNKKQIQKLKFWHWVLIVSALLLFISAVLSILTSQEQLKISKNEEGFSNFDRSNSTFKNIYFSGIELSLPDFFRVFSIEEETNVAELLANRIINEKKLLIHETIPNYWTSDTAELAKSEYEKNFTFVEFSEGEKSDLNIIKNEAIKVCQNFYSKYQVGENLQVKEDEIVYLNNDDEQHEVDQKDAKIMIIPLSYNLDGFDLFFQNEGEYPFMCKVSNKYVAEKIVFKDLFYNFKPIAELSPISIDQAVSNIKKGDGAIIKAESQIVNIIDLSWINEANLYSVEIDYRYDEKLKIAYPFYKFKAKLTNSGGINIEAVIITPAVKTAKE